MFKHKRIKQGDFWGAVEARVRENQVLISGGMSGRWAPVMEKVGLHFWVVGVVVSLIMAAGLWLYDYAGLMRIVRVMIWR